MDLYAELEWRGLISESTEGLREALASAPVTAYIGFDPTARLRSTERFKDLGLLGMEERVALVGGRLQIDSKASAGTTVTAWFPLRWREAGAEFDAIL